LVAELWQISTADEVLSLVGQGAGEGLAVGVAVGVGVVVPPPPPPPLHAARNRAESPKPVRAVLKYINVRSEFCGESQVWHREC
jgi:hypothetical protein